MKTLILDNYDSFTYNLYQYLGELNANPEILKNNKITIPEIEKMNPSHIVISPGPGNPENPVFFGICTDVILKLGPKIPLLGVCLGHQGIIHAFKGKIIKAPKIMHGQTSLIKHNEKGIFKNIENPFSAMRYHSLIGAKHNFPNELEITAKTMDEAIIMAVQHKSHPIFGIQFHPESIGTPQGKKILKNFLSLRTYNPS